MEFLTRHLDPEQLATTAVTFVPRLAVALVIMAAFWLLYRLSRRPLRATLAPHRHP